MREAVRPPLWTGRLRARPVHSLTTRLAAELMLLISLLPPGREAAGDLDVLEEAPSCPKRPSPRPTMQAPRVTRHVTTQGTGMTLPAGRRRRLRGRLAGLERIDFAAVRTATPEPVSTGG